MGEFQTTAGKILSMEAAQRTIAAWRARGERIVMANGCFDPLHVGHARYLDGARELGDRLVVAVNDDAGTAALKGPGRPVMPAADRARLLAALRAVDAVVVFSGTNVNHLLETLRPDIHAKGTDYTPQSVPERALAEQLGIRIAITGDPKQHASTDLLERLRRRPEGME